MVLALWTTSALSQKKYDPGASDTEIRIGNTAPYSGPAAAIGNLGRAQVAYWKSVNASGGINGRKVTLVSLDDGYSPPKTVEVTRQLVEQEGVLATFGSIGTATQSAVQRYLNGKKVPQLLIASGAAKWNNPKEFPWSMSFYPQNDVEASVYAKYILQAKPDAKIAVLYQNDDFGKDFVRGLRRGLGERAGKMIVKEA
ncbi:MAG TPA: ABC transporter substrate-binding protein, partial [Ramlibacter sp.]|nr:ABC transporter substrate-binding protein [Ramlibacter sp.]